MFKTTLLAALALTAAPSFAAEVYEGEHLHGATYHIEVPDAWNGDLVIYAHGIQRPWETPSFNPPNAQFPLQIFTSLGYAVAATSYSDVGWAVEEAGGEVHQLRDVFADLVGEPEKTLMTGVSMGGLVGAEQIESFTSQYDGALLFCPAVGGLDDESEYLLETVFLFDYFFPGVLGFDPTQPVPVGAYDAYMLQQNVPAALLADLYNPASQGSKLFQLANVIGADLPVGGASQQEVIGSMVQSIATGVVYGSVFASEILDRADGWTFGNIDTVYAGSFDDTALNAGVARVIADKAGLKYAAKHYEPTGNINVPTIINTTVLDPVVPIYNTFEYAAKIDAAGNGDLLAIQTVNAYGHCNYQPGELLASFIDLVTWVEYGVAPTRTDVTGAPLP